jgi:hypothetical protein
VTYALAPLAKCMADVKLQAALVQKWIGISASESMMFLIARRPLFGSNFNVRVVDFTELPHSPSIGQQAASLA